MLNPGNRYVLNEIVIDEDPLLLGLLCDALCSIDKVKESIEILASKLREFPYLVTLLLKQASAFIKYEYYEYGMRLAKICVDLCPESFECWIHLAEAYFHCRKFKMVRNKRLTQIEFSEY